MPVDRSTPTSATIVGVAFLTLVGCSAKSAPKPTYTIPITAESTVRADNGVDVIVSSATGVVLTDDERNRVQGLIKKQIDERKIRNAADGRVGSYEVDVLLTQYDEGSSVARLMLAGLGQIHVTGNIKMLELPDHKLVGEFEVSKTFAWGGLYGASTTIQDVDVGFANGVAAAVTGTTD